MGAPAAAANAMVTAVDTHIVMVPTHGGLIASVKIGGQAAAVVGSTASNNPPHLPTPPGTSFQAPPANKGTVFIGSATVKIGGQAAARSGDTVTTCNDPADAPVGQIVAAGTVRIG